MPITNHDSRDGILGDRYVRHNPHLQEEESFSWLAPLTRRGPCDRTYRSTFASHPLCPNALDPHSYLDIPRHSIDLPHQRNSGICTPSHLLRLAWEPGEASCRPSAQLARRRRFLGSSLACVPASL